MKLTDNSKDESDPSSKSTLQSTMFLLVIIL